MIGSVAPPVARLEHHQPHERLDRDRRAPVSQRQRLVLGVPIAPQLPHRRVHVLRGQQRVDRAQLRAQQLHAVPQHRLKQARLPRAAPPSTRHTRTPSIAHMQVYLSAPSDVPRVYPGELTMHYADADATDACRATARAAATPASSSTTSTARGGEGSDQAPSAARWHTRRELDALARITGRATGTVDAQALRKSGRVRSCALWRRGVLRER